MADSNDEYSAYYGMVLPKAQRKPPTKKNEPAAKTVGDAECTVDDALRSPAVRPPTVDEVAALCQDLGFWTSEKELKGYHELIAATTRRYQSWATIPEPTLPVRYPRSPGYRPPKEENPCNAWIQKTDIHGAETGKLCGRTVAVKDVIPVSGVPMRAGSFLLDGFVPDFDATVVTRVLDAGGRITGKSACEDLSFSGSSVTSYYGPIQNPYDPSRSAGGSSNGSAVLVSLGEADLALGTDILGSVRIPACCCGIVGMKPTFGLVPYTGICSMETSLDTAGILAKTVKDCASFLQVVAGFDNGLDPRQPVTLPPIAPDYTEMLESDSLACLRVGLLKEGFTGREMDVDSLVRSAAYRLREAGAEVDEVSVPMHATGCDLTMSIFLEGCYRTEFLESGVGHGWRGFYPTQISDSLRRAMQCDANKTSPTYKLAKIHAAYISKNYGMHFYAKAQNLLRELTKAYEKVFETYDVIIMPTMPTKAPKLPTASEGFVGIVKHAFSTTVNTPQFNGTGHPALSINAGFCSDLPVGMQIVGRHFEEGVVLRVAYAFECIRDSFTVKSREKAPEPVNETIAETETETVTETVKETVTETVIETVTEKEKEPAKEGKPFLSAAMALLKKEEKKEKKEKKSKKGSKKTSKKEEDSRRSVATASTSTDTAEDASSRVTYVPPNAGMTVLVPAGKPAEDDAGHRWGSATIINVTH